MKDLLAEVPDDIARNIHPLLTNPQALLHLPEDISHSQAYHGQRMMRMVNWVAYEVDTTPLERIVARRVALLHDKGYTLVKAGILKPEEHHWGSYILAKIANYGPMVTQAILDHNQDVLPAETPTWTRLVRDLDRVLAGGFEGMARIAILLGLEPYGMVSGELIKSGALTELFDSRHPREEVYRKERIIPPPHFGDTTRMIVEETDYEVHARQFCQELVLPFLASHGLLNQMEQFLNLWIDWYSGSEKDDARHLSDNPFEVWNIEPVSDIVAAVFDLKLKNTEEALYMIQHAQRLLTSSSFEKPSITTLAPNSFIP